MPGKFISPDGDLETMFVNDYEMIDQFAATGSLWAWGMNSNGQLGDFGTVRKSSPVQTISGGTNWKQVSAQSTGTAAIKTDGTLWMWGLNSNGQLGTGDNTNHQSPVQTIAGGTNWKQVNNGNQHTVAIKTDGTLWLWGRNNDGQLGNNTTGDANSQSSPVQTIAGGTNWKQVACGQSSTAAVKTDGTLWLWGRNNYGQLGDNTQVGKSSPIQTIAGGNTWKQVSCGNGFSAAVKTDGTLWLWGRNSYGTLASGVDRYDKFSPVQTISAGANWKQVETIEDHVAAIKTDGTLWLWGRNSYGQLGDNTIGSKSSPVQTISGGTNWKQIACASYHTAAIKTDGTLWVWGRNSYGELGNNTIAHKSSPIQTIAGGTNWKQVAKGGAWHTAAIYFYDADNLYPSA